MQSRSLGSSQASRFRGMRDCTNVDMKIGELLVEAKLRKSQSLIRVLMAPPRTTEA